MHVFLTGASGLIGTALARALTAGGHAVTALTRSGAARGLPVGVTVLRGDPTRPGPWQDALRRCDACVHLAGEPIASGRWTAERKRAIRDSRVESTRRVAEVIAAGGPTVLVSASAVGYYGPRGDEVLDESAPPGDDFLARVCRDWEAAAGAGAARARVVLARLGIVLAREGGALQQMLLPFRFFAGGPIGRGDFWQAWIHLDDVVAMLAWALEAPGASGPLNVTAPAPVRNRDLAAAIGRALRRPSAIPIPPLALRLAMGELATVVTTGQRVVPARAVALGFRHRFDALDRALADLLVR